MSTAPIVRINNEGWRPPQWNKPPQVLLIVPAAGGPTSSIGTTGNGLFTLSTGVTGGTSYVFDAVLSLEHDQTVTKTRHPIQTGSAISSHAYVEPAALVMYVLMSDVTPQYVAQSQLTSPYIQQWTGDATSKSVSAYQTVIDLQLKRVLFTVVTRLRTYYNMLITKVSPHEDSKSITGARFRLELEQIFVATTDSLPVSTRQNDTNSTSTGAVTPQSPSTTTETQFNINESSATPPPTTYNVPGAGSYSSVNTNSLQSLAV